MLLALAQANGVELDLTARTGLEASDNMSLSNEGGEQDVRQTVVLIWRCLKRVEVFRPISACPLSIVSITKKVTRTKPLWGRV